MKYKRAATRLKKMFDSELNTLDTLPPLKIDSDEFVFYQCKIKLNHQDMWELSTLDNNSKEIFRLRASALIAAKCKYTQNFKDIQRIRLLDSAYWHYSTDEVIFKQKLKHIKDLDRYLLIKTRHDNAESNALATRKLITNIFNSLFNQLTFESQLNNSR